MSDEKKKLIKETVEDLKQLDMNSLLLMKHGAELLKSRDALDKQETAGEKVSVGEERAG